MRPTVVIVATVWLIGLAGMSCAEPTPLDQVYGKYQSAIFYVEYVPAVGPSQRVGTATLVDKRGYFITASHAVGRIQEEGPGATNATECHKATPFTGVLRLTNQDGVSVLAREMAGIPYGIRDFTIIQAQDAPDKVAALGAIDVPAMYIGEDVESAPREGVLIAFPNSETTLLKPPEPGFGGVGPPLDAQGQFKLVQQFSFLGQSGGPAFDKAGELIGVLVGPEQASCSGKVAANQFPSPPGYQILHLTATWDATVKLALLRIAQSSTATAITSAVLGETAVPKPLSTQVAAARVSALDIFEAAAALPRLPPSSLPETALSAQDNQGRIDFIDSVTKLAESEHLVQEVGIFGNYCPFTTFEADCEQPALQGTIYTLNAAAKPDGSVDASAISWAQQRLAALEAGRAPSALHLASNAQLYSAAISTLGNVEALAGKPVDSQREFATAFYINAANATAAKGLYSSHLLAGNKSAARETAIDFLQYEIPKAGSAPSRSQLNTFSDVQLNQMVLGASVTPP